MSAKEFVKGYSGSCWIVPYFLLHHMPFSNQESPVKISHPSINSVDGFRHPTIFSVIVLPTPPICNVHPLTGIMKTRHVNHSEQSNVLHKHCIKTYNYLSDLDFMIVCFIHFAWHPTPFSLTIILTRAPSRAELV